ncbi:MAG: hypothetical protein Q8941_06240 [Bacteroidota bacterium]|nr:hypothetical protein [Bacteroidota bacterium]
MKFLSIKRIILAVLFIVATALFSCKKESSSSANSSQPAVTEADAATYSDESSQAEGSFDDVEDISMQAADEEGAVSAPNGRLFPFVHLRLRLGDCAVITVTPNDSTYPKTVTIDFPGDGCWCADGKHRKGTIILNFTGPIRRPGSVLTITLQNFYLNRAHVEGTKTISNLSANGAVKYSVQVTGGKFTLPSGRGYQYEATKTKTQVDGMATADNQDDVYNIEGRSKTTFNNNNLVITLDTETPLVKKVACDWISDGILKIKINDRVLFLDYGAPNNGDCDNQALLTWNNGNSHRLITLP